MPKQFSNDHLNAESEVRQRLADRLGFLLAKRWIRLRQATESRLEDNPTRIPYPGIAGNTTQDITTA